MLEATTAETPPPASSIPATSRGNKTAVAAMITAKLMPRTKALATIGLIPRASARAARCANRGGIR